jgi:hypothetical protein
VIGENTNGFICGIHLFGRMPGGYTILEEYGVYNGSLLENWCVERDS